MALKLLSACHIAYLDAAFPLTSQTDAPPQCAGDISVGRTGAAGLGAGADVWGDGE